jgi:hypothetical protein
LPHGPSDRAHPRLYRSVRGQSLEAMSGFGELRKFTDTRLGRMGRVLDPLRTGAESKSRNAAISRRIPVCCPFGEEAQAQHTPRGFRTIQVYPKDVGGICGHTRSVNRPTLFKLTHQGRREGDHDAPLFAEPSVVGSAGHRLPAKYLGWSECARSRGFSGLVVHGTLQDGRPT